jgi:hypothetical protein
VSHAHQLLVLGLAASFQQRKAGSWTLAASLFSDF